MEVTLQEQGLVSAAPAPQAIDALKLATALLFTHGQTTTRTIQVIERLSRRLDTPAIAIASWDGIVLVSPAHHASADAEQENASSVVVHARPTAVDMGKVAATVSVIDRIFDGRLLLPEAVATLQQIQQRPPASTLRFSIMAGMGAMALAVIFGAEHLLSLALIGLSGFLGGQLRRAIARASHNSLIQPFAAAFLAGVIGGCAVHLDLTSLQRLVAVCPCMVLVPGPHLLNGAIDMLRGRIFLGLARLAFAAAIVLAISIGLLLGLAVDGTYLPVDPPSRAVPFLIDIVAAAIAVAAYGTFFSMPWRLIVIPVILGVMAHGARWLAIAQADFGPAAGALVACLLVGILATPIADRFRLPFAGLAFASVVSLIPGVFLFRAAGAVAAAVSRLPNTDIALIHAVIVDGATALAIVAAMTVGLIAPKMAIEWATLRHSSRRHRLSPDKSKF